MHFHTHSCPSNLKILEPFPAEVAMGADDDLPHPLIMKGAKERK